MKLVSPKQKISTTGSSERINFSNEIENITLESDMYTLKLSDFNSDIIHFYTTEKSPTYVELFITCDRTGRKYTFIASNRTLNRLRLRFMTDKEYSTEYEHSVEKGTSMILDLYQTADYEIHVVRHTLN